MAKIPDVTSFGSRPVPNPQGGIAPYPAGGIGEAVQALGQAGVRAGASIRDERERQARLAEAERNKPNLLEEAQAKSSYLQAQFEAQKMLESEADYTQYETKYTDYMREAQGKALAVITNPTRRALVEQDFNQDLVRSTQRVWEYAKTKEVDAGKTNYFTQRDALLNIATTTNDPARARQAMATLGEQLEGAVQKGYFDPEQAYRLGKEATSDFSLASITRMSASERLRAVGAAGPQARDNIRFSNPSGQGDDEVLNRIMLLESSGDPSAVNGDSGAAGLFQIVPSTAAYLGIKDPKDPEQAWAGARRLLSENRDTLKKRLGRDPSPQELYLAHQQGASGASELLSNPEENAVTALSKAYSKSKNPEASAALAIRQNGGTEDMTAGEFAGMWASRFDKAGTGVSVSNSVPGLAANLTWEQRLRIAENAKSELSVEARKGAAEIEGAASLGIFVPKENIYAVAAKAEEAGDDATASSLYRFATVQNDSRRFADMPLVQQRNEIAAVKQRAEAGDLREQDRFEVYSKTYDHKIKALSTDPWSYYEERKIVSEPQPLDLANPDATQAALTQRRIEARKVAFLEDGAVTLPLLNKAEIEQIGEIFKEGKSEDAANVIANIGAALNQEERRALTVAVKGENALMGAALNMTRQEAYMLIEGSKIEGAIKERDLRKETDRKLSKFIYNSEDNEIIHGAIYAYYKKLALDRGDVTDTPNPDLVDEAIKAVVGEPLEITMSYSAFPDSGAGANEYHNMLQGYDSRVLSYRKDDGEYASANDLEDILGSITDDRLIAMNGNLPVASDGSKIGAAKILKNARFFSAADGVYNAYYEGLGVLSDGKGRAYPFDARKIDALRKEPKRANP